MFDEYNICTTIIIDRFIQFKICLCFNEDICISNRVREKRMVCNVQVTLWS